MFDIGWTEIAFIAIVALLVIGPKDLPKVLRTVGQWVGKARAMAREFQRSVDDMIRESELEDLKKQVDGVRDFSVKGQIEKAIDPTGDLKNAFDVGELDQRTREAVEAMNPEIAEARVEKTPPAAPTPTQQPQSAPAAPEAVPPKGDAAP